MFKQTSNYLNSISDLSPGCSAGVLKLSLRLRTPFPFISPRGPSRRPRPRPSQRFLGLLPSVASSSSHSRWLSWSPLACPTVCYRSLVQADRLPRDRRRRRPTPSPWLTGSPRSPGPLSLRDRLVLRRSYVKTTRHAFHLLLVFSRVLLYRRSPVRSAPGLPCLRLCVLWAFVVLLLLPVAAGRGPRGPNAIVNASVIRLCDIGDGPLRSARADECLSIRYHCLGTFGIVLSEPFPVRLVGQR